jgi:hypothetical protein
MMDRPSNFAFKFNLRRFTEEEARSTPLARRLRAHVAAVLAAAAADPPAALGGGGGGTGVGGGDGDALTDATTATEVGRCRLTL